MAEKDNETSPPPVVKVTSFAFILGIRVLKKKKKKRYKGLIYLQKKKKVS